MCRVLDLELGVLDIEDGRKETLSGINLKLSDGGVIFLRDLSGLSFCCSFCICIITFPFVGNVFGRVRDQPIVDSGCQI